LPAEVLLFWGLSHTVSYFFQYPCHCRIFQGGIKKEVSPPGCQWPSGSSILDRPNEEAEIEVDPEAMTELVESPSASPSETTFDDGPLAAPTLATPDILRDTTPAQVPSAVFHSATDPPAKTEGVAVSSTSGALTTGSGIFPAAVLGFVASVLVSLF